MAKSIYYITISNALEGRVKIKTEKWQQNSPKQSREHAGGPKYIEARQISIPAGTVRHNARQSDNNLQLYLETWTSWVRDSGLKMFWLPGGMLQKDNDEIMLFICINRGWLASNLLPSGRFSNRCKYCFSKVFFT